ncbi:HET-domain-containing protein [Hypoxylon trugodes]|uniref:HET-domain-containing protein n=1 Tax=Hypoxylon trugodes TaxID=326681 RepID=UPI002199ADDB|nr:HET-domain-containing protein [Hypoxylon trugodes]KAI1383102.1 HET-domain-containing protein [Hypoxylon trugodes]
MNAQENLEPSLLSARIFQRQIPFEEEDSHCANSNSTVAQKECTTQRGSDVVDSSSGLQDNGHALCSTCTSADLASLIVKVQAKPADAFTVRLIRRQNPQLDSPACPLCNVISWMLQADPDADRGGYMVLILATAKSDILFPYNFKRRKQIFCFLILREWPMKSTAPRINRLASVIISQSFLDTKHIHHSRLQKPLRKCVDYWLIQWWLSRCAYNHTNCKPPKVRLRAPSKLKLIDCQTLSIVEAQPSYDYFALSYVWGPKKSCDFPPRGVEDFPATIRDAIKVTRELGCQYLWVDRYCINQNDSTHKHDQIRQMGRIYNQASLTIIAAAGSDPDYGLSGVSRERDEIPSRTFWNWRIDGFHAHPSETIRKSVWMTRSWTYQEALLSRRRLIFTDEQVYFECQGSVREEFLTEDFGVSDLGGVVSMFHDSVFGTQLSEIFTYISEYSQRNLTYEGDYLDGFLGILGSLAEAKYPIRHLFGVPIFPSVACDDSEPCVSAIKHKSCGCRLMMGMNWGLENGARRRGHGFPSWSWVGWSGSVTWDAYDSSSFSVLDSDNEVRVEDTSGRILPLEMICNSSDDLLLEHYSLSKILHINSEVSEVKVVYLRQELRDAFRLLPLKWADGWGLRESYLGLGCWATWEVRGGLLVYIRCILFEDLGKNSMRDNIAQIGKFKVLVTGKFHKRGIIHGRLIQDVGEGYEVVGRVSFHDHNMYARNVQGDLETLTLQDIRLTMAWEWIRLL